MNSKLTYKIKDIINKNEYTDVIIKHKRGGEDITVRNANIRFRYETKVDRVYLSFGNKEIYTVCEVEDEFINEVIITDEFLSIETAEKSYYCYTNDEKLYY